MIGVKNVFFLENTGLWHKKKPDFIKKAPEII